MPYFSRKRAALRSAGTSIPTPTISFETRSFRKRRHTIRRSSSVLYAIARGAWNTGLYAARPIADSSCAVGNERQAQDGRVVDVRKEEHVVVVAAAFERKSRSSGAYGPCASINARS